MRSWPPRTGFSGGKLPPNCDDYSHPCVPHTGYCRTRRRTSAPSETPAGEDVTCRRGQIEMRSTTFRDTPMCRLSYNFVVRVSEWPAR